MLSDDGAQARAAASAAEPDRRLSQQLSAGSDTLALLQMFMGQLAAVATPMPLIVDTDIGGGSCRDVDDVGAVCIRAGG